MTMKAENTTEITLRVLKIFLPLGVAACQLGGMLNLDVSWLMHVAERILSGERLSIDVVETNPPLIVWLMLPAAALGIGSAGLVLYVTALCFVSFLACSRIIPREKWRNKWDIIILVVLFLIPATNFGQREHFFIIFALPFLLQIVFGRQKFHPLAIGFVAGVGIAIKHYFALIALTMIFVDAIFNRDWRRIFTPTNWVILGTLISYLLILVFVEQNYINLTLPQMWDYYDGFKTAFSVILPSIIAAGFIFLLGFLLVLLVDKKLLPKESWFFAAASLASTITIIIQQKGWLNHYLPLEVFAFILNISLAIKLFPLATKNLWLRTARIFVGLCLAILLGLAVVKTGWKIANLYQDDTKKILAHYESVGDKNIYPLSFDLFIFPHVYHTEAQYGGKFGHLWQLPGIYQNATLNENLEVIYNPPAKQNEKEKQLKALIISEIKTQKPALILVADRPYYSPLIGDFKFDFVKYFSIEPEFREIFKNYQLVDQIDEMLVYRYNESVNENE